MQLVGLADIDTGWRMRAALKKGFRLFASLEDRAEPMRKAGLTVLGTLDDLLSESEVVVDCTPKCIGAKNAEHYRARELKFIVQGGEKHEVAGHSFVSPRRAIQVR
jgi:glyceraldehyde-3-phosphate dehydrogenase (NAD(P))